MAQPENGILENHIPLCYLSVFILMIWLPWPNSGKAMGLVDKAWNIVGGAHLSAPI